MFFLTGCQESGGTLCIEGDLGRYRIEFVTEMSSGCRARYRDPDGKLAIVNVAKGTPGLFGDGGTPAEFEKHHVFHRRAKDGIQVGWHCDSLGVTVYLQGLAVPQGPVLRAYLFKYHSGVTAQMAAARRRVEELKHKSRHRPKDSRVHLELARKYRKLGNNLMATQEYHISVDYDHTCYVCYLEMATLYRKLNHWDLAIRAARRAGALKPDDPAPVVLLGDVFYRVHNGQEALRTYRKALEAGLEGDELKRVEKRIGELEGGKYMIEVLPGARKHDRKDAGSE